MLAISQSLRVYAAKGWGVEHDILASRICHPRLSVMPIALVYISTIFEVHVIHCQDTLFAFVGPNMGCTNTYTLEHSYI